MALAKAVVTGTVFRAPEKRFTQNNVPVSSFVLKSRIQYYQSFLGQSLKIFK